MIVYKKSKNDFLSDIEDNHIEDLVRDAVKTRLNRRVGQSEYDSWQRSLQYLITDTISDDAVISSDCCTVRILLGISC
jgi:hypothetical protein